MAHHRWEERPGQQGRPPARTPLTAAPARQGALPRISSSVQKQLFLRNNQQKIAYPSLYSEISSVTGSWGWINHFVQILLQSLYQCKYCLSFI